MKEDKKNTWYDNFVALSAVIVLLGGIAAYGYGAVKSLCDSIKRHHGTHAKAPKQTEQTAVPFQMARQRMFERSK